MSNQQVTKGRIVEFFPSEIHKRSTEFFKGLSSVPGIVTEINYEDCISVMLFSPNDSQPLAFSKVPKKNAAIDSSIGEVCWDWFPIAGAKTEFRPLLQTGIGIIDLERERQLRPIGQGEGFTREHDLLHSKGELAIGAAVYAIPEHVRKLIMAIYNGVPHVWPFEPESWKPTPKNRIKELAKAGALIAAEIDRLLALEAQEKTE